ncbi:PilZ domain-containing protein [Lacimicrobium sp. SS2-24]|uniref:PilZ domain-containing protein n=1 Tax=Lacimicrobium sp. SS2-24 TaxID=2005569 RepID=UPI000B4AAE36|nr:PilZ domain-containing protein [Lacimicrobium sp. SS2-24]
MVGLKIKHQRQRELRVQEKQQYAPPELLEELIPSVRSNNFDTILRQKTSDLSTNQRFLLKMELKRLCKPCVRRIDLRGMVDGQCEPYEFQGRTHYLDALAQEIFKQQLALYSTYTQGVYEALQRTPNRFTLIQQTQHTASTHAEASTKADPGQTDASLTIPTFHYRNYPIRCEERMHFAIELEVRLNEQKSIKASSTNISASGLQLKIASETSLESGQRLTIFFRGLEQEYVLEPDGVEYDVVRTRQRKDMQYVSLQRCQSEQSTGFDKLLSTFIHGNKRRYKVNLDNTLEAVFSKGFEQYHLSTLTALPIFFGRSSKGHSCAHYALLNEQNSSLYEQFQKNQSNGLCQLLAPARLARLITEAQQNPDMLLYSFSYLKNQTRHWYFATSSELDDDRNLKAAFLSFAVRQKDWHVYHLRVNAVEPQQSYYPSSLPDSLGEQTRKDNRPPSARVMSRINHLTHMLVMTEITNPKAASHCSAYPLSKADLTRVNRLFLCRTANRPQIVPVELQYRSLRAEPRYQHQSEVLVTHQGLSLKAMTADISSHGLKLSLSGPLPSPELTNVSLNFTQLQEVTSKYRLCDITYEVVAYDAEALELKLRLDDDFSDANRQASRFFTELIDRNKRKLIKDPERQSNVEIADALKVIYVRNNHLPALFMSREKGRCVPEALSLPVMDYSLRTLFAENDTATSLDWLFKGKNGQYLQQWIKQQALTAEPLCAELLLTVGGDGNINAVFVDDFSTQHLLTQFIRINQRQGRFKAIRLMLQPTGRPDISRFENELRYISLYARHKAKALEETLWNISYVCFLADISAEILNRYAIAIQEIDKLTDNIEG